MLLLLIQHQTSVGLQGPSVWKFPGDSAVTRNIFTIINLYVIMLLRSPCKRTNQAGETFCCKATLRNRFPSCRRVRSCKRLPSGQLLQSWLVFSELCRFLLAFGGCISFWRNSWHRFSILSFFFLDFSVYFHMNLDISSIYFVWYINYMSNI